MKVKKLLTQTMQDGQIKFIPSVKIKEEDKQCSSLLQIISLHPDTIPTKNDGIIVETADDSAIYVSSSILGIDNDDPRYPRYVKVLKSIKKRNPASYEKINSWD